MCCSSRRNEGPRLTVIINGSKISLLVDTGSPINILDEKTFKSLVSKPVLEKCNTRYYGFTAKEPLTIFGQFTARIECKDKSASAGFIVIKGDAECLMSYVTAKALGVISLNIQQISGVTNSLEGNSANVCNDSFLTTDQLVTKFPNLFSGKLGCLKDFEVKLYIDPDVRQERQPQRPVPFHLRDAVEKELLYQVEQGVLEKVDETSGPTPWVANLVIVPKNRDLNSNSAEAAEKSAKTTDIAVTLTCDSRAQNKAIRRTRYPSKTVEDLVYLVNGSTMFSKLDIANAFH